MQFLNRLLQNGQDDNSIREEERVLSYISQYSTEDMNDQEKQLRVDITPENNDLTEEHFEFKLPGRRIRIKPKRGGELTCKYCEKKLINQNAHSGHMRSCRTSMEIRKQFLAENRAIFESEEVALERWNSLDHSYFNLFEYETPTSLEALAFIKSKVSVMGDFPEDRLKEYCIFYLVVLAQIADSKTVREDAFKFLVDLLSEDEVIVLKNYWKGLGNRRYEPSVESYAKTWEKFVRIKDDCFFNIDYPAWILLLDRYILTYKMFGWEINSANTETAFFRDIVLFNIFELLMMEQYYVHLPNTNRFQAHVPKGILKFLHVSSRERFAREEQHWVKLAEMPYDPRDPDSARFI